MSQAESGQDRGSSHGDAVLGDRSVLSKVRQRDADALGRIYDAAFPYVFGLAFRFTGDRARAEDVAQDVFLKVYRAADRVDPSRHLKPWLTAITLNACRDRLRRRSRRAERVVDPSTIDAIGHTARGPEYELVRDEEQRALTRGLLALDAKLREVVVLRTYSGISHEEAAGLLGISPAAARKRYSRALQELRALVGRTEP